MEAAKASVPKPRAKPALSLNGLFAEFEYIPSRYTLGDEIRAKVRARPLRRRRRGLTPARAGAAGERGTAARRQRRQTFQSSRRGRRAEARGHAGRQGGFGDAVRLGAALQRRVARLRSQGEAYPYLANPYDEAQEIERRKKWCGPQPRPGPCRKPARRG